MWNMGSGGSVGAGSPFEDVWVLGVLGFRVWGFKGLGF